MHITVSKDILSNGDVCGHIDAVELTAYGVIRVVGWCSHKPEILIQSAAGPIPVSHFYKRNRPDAAAYLSSDTPFVGFMAEYFYTGDYPIILKCGDDTDIFIEGSPVVLNSTVVPYDGFFKADAVLHRKDIYGEGPPTTEGHPEIIAFADSLTGPILDFGCGNGFMVDRWLKASVPAKGVEIDRAAIRETLLPGLANAITLYDGSLPLPFGDAEFETVYASEVIEHVPNYLETIEEIARVCRSTFAITVPDMTSLPIGSVNWIVPWHLLEATHVNFFSKPSLERVLKKHFRHLEFFNLGAGTVNGAYMPGSLGCIARK